LSTGVVHSGDNRADHALAAQRRNRLKIVNATTNTMTIVDSTGAVHGRYDRGRARQDDGLTGVLVTVTITSSRLCRAEPRIVIFALSRI
jgi:hypothetical protein